ncbi:hypothetical protein, partial [Stenotrophomonas maltophilia]|uniref:hypothetical protein n=1 Tax=Stenotrophomonas maltophilia TaxID=40324 RepID=UPI001953988F
MAKGAREGKAGESPPPPAGLNSRGIPGFSAPRHRDPFTRPRRSESGSILEHALEELDLVAEHRVLADLLL